MRIIKLWTGVPCTSCNKGHAKQKFLYQVIGEKLVLPTDSDHFQPASSPKTIYYECEGCNRQFPQIVAFHEIPITIHVMGIFNGRYQELPLKKNLRFSDVYSQNKLVNKQGRYLFRIGQRVYKSEDKNETPKSFLIAPKRKKAGIRVTDPLDTRNRNLGNYISSKFKLSFSDDKEMIFESLRDYLVPAVEVLILSNEGKLFPCWIPEASI